MRCSRPFRQAWASVAHPNCDTMYRRGLMLWRRQWFISEWTNVSQGFDAMATTMVHIRVDEKVKEDAAKTLAAMGMSVSDAVRMLLVRVAAEKALQSEERRVGKECRSRWS